MARITINFAPLSVRGATKVFVGRHPYAKDRLDALRQEFHATHIFRRESAETFIDLPIAGDTQPLGTIREEIDLSRSERLWPSLVSAALIRAFQVRNPVQSGQRLRSKADTQMVIADSR
jgi:hypothetical protein